MKTRTALFALGRWRAAMASPARMGHSPDKASMSRLRYLLTLFGADQHHISPWRAVRPLYGRPAAPKYRSQIHLPE